MNWQDEVINSSVHLFGQTKVNTSIRFFLSLCCRFRSTDQSDILSSYEHRGLSYYVYMHTYTKQKVVNSQGKKIQLESYYVYPFWRHAKFIQE